jgi:hypothetical protein
MRADHGIDSLEMHMTLPTTVPDRRIDLDWLRIAAFGLLIFYHVGMFYVTWGFHVKSSHAGPAAEPLMLLLNPWRLTLLFVISGCATRFMLDKMNSAAFLRSRTTRLVVPLLFGMFVVVPPQTYFEIVEKLGYSGSFGDFYASYASASGGWGMITPTWNHLWFVAYLFIYTLLIVVLGPLLKRLPAWIIAPLAKGVPLILIPLLFLLVIRVLLEPIFEETHALVDDWYAHALYFPAFVFGYAIAKHEAFFESCQRMRWPALVMSLAAWALLTAHRSGAFSWGEESSLPIALTGATLRELQAWSMILALFGFARRHLRRDNALRRYLTDAIFPFYIVHQTTIVVAGHYLDQIGLPVWIEAFVLIASTIASCWLVYEVVRRISALRPLFGLKLKGRARTGGPALAAN